MNHLKRLQTVISEYQQALSNLNNSNVCFLTRQILQANRIFILGAGRTRCVLQMFAMRLAQTSIPTHMVGEVTTPAIMPEDLLIAASGSGETASVITLSQQARKTQAPIFGITATANSTLQNLSEHTLLLPPPTGGNTQLLGNFCETCLLLVLDQVIEEILDVLQKPATELQKTHANIE